LPDPKFATRPVSAPGAWSRYQFGGSRRESNEWITIGHIGFSETARFDFTMSQEAPRYVTSDVPTTTNRLSFCPVEGISETFPLVCRSGQGLFDCL
jgi:hypothetical protein